MLWFFLFRSSLAREDSVLLRGPEVLCLWNNLIRVGCRAWDCLSDTSGSEILLSRSIALVTYLVGSISRSGQITPPGNVG